MSTIEREWAEKEFAGVNIGDKRLNERVKKVAEILSASPESSINEASRDWGVTQASYRLFQNERVRPEDILKPHQERTIQRMRGEKVVLAIQDTTFFNYNTHRKTKGLGPIGSSGSDAQGLMAHSVLCVTAKAGVPLGVLHCVIKARKGYLKRTAKELVATPFDKKESKRWVDALRVIHEVTPKECRVVTVGDRENDIYEFLHEAQALGAEFVIRSNNDRGLKGELNLRAFMSAQPVLGVRQIKLPKTEKAPKRTVNLTIQCGEVSLKKPKYRELPLGPAPSLYAVLTTEIKPKGAPVSWLLLTNIPVKTLEEAEEKIDWYQKRWRIEELHKILKSGCDVESCRLQTAKRLTNYLTFMWVVAWRIFRLTHLSRSNPKASASEILTKSEIQTLIALGTQNLAPPTTTLTVAEAVQYIGQLGGFLRRKHDRHPGTKNIWKGWARLQDANLLGSLVFANKRCV